MLAAKKEKCLAMLARKCVLYGVKKVKTLTMHAKKKKRALCIVQ
jgi:hypothetical protein